ncbi:hypothetical protein MMC22_011007 [Lobaria immixta]|nr:hypothetical protein [Lobaria immixta]
MSGDSSLIPTILRWTKDNVVDFWLHCLAGVQTIETGEPSVIGWLAGHDDLTWCKALVIASPSFMLGKKIDSQTMHKILRSVCTFDHTTTELDDNRSTFPRIAKGMPDQPLQLEGLTALAESDDKAKRHSNDEEFSDEEKF